MKHGILEIVVIIEAIVIAGLLGYIFFELHEAPSYGNFARGTTIHINQSAQNEVASVFGNATNQSDVNSYCQSQQNIPNCIYYCRNNPDNQYCSSFLSGRSAFYGGGGQ